MKSHAKFRSPQAEQERQQREIAQQKLTEMESLLNRYREKFGDLSD